MAQWRTAAGTLATPALWSAASTWQYWNGLAWTAAPNGAQNYPSTSDDVLFHGGFRVLLDIDADINTITNITTNFNGTHTALTNVSGLVYNTARTLICRGTTSVALTANTNISATDQSLIYPIANNTIPNPVSITIGSSALPTPYPAYIRGLATATGSRGTLSLLDAPAAAGAGVNYTVTINIVGTGGGGLFGGSAGNGIWIGNGSTLTLNLDGNFAANGGSAVQLNNSGSLILNINGTIQPSGSVPAISLNAAGPAITINTKTPGTTNISGGSGTASLISTNYASSAFVLNLSEGSTITAGAGTGTNGAAINLLTPTTSSVTLTGVNVTASTSAFALNAGSGVNTYTYTSFSLLKDSVTNTPCIITNTTARAAIISPVLNSDSSTIFKIKTTSGVNNDFQVNTGGVVPAASDVRAGIPVGISPAVGTLNVPSPSDVRSTVPVDATVGTLVVPSAATVLKDVVYDATTQGTLDIPNAVAQVVGNIVANLT